MSLNFLHYKVELAFDRMEEAVLEAQEHATSEGKVLYDHLKDELFGLREHFRQELLDLHTKKAASAAATTETAKSDSDKESNFSLEENPEDVKRSQLVLVMRDEKKIEAKLSINGPAEHLLRLMSAAVETITFAAPDVLLGPEDLEKAIHEGRDHALERLAEKGIQMIFESGFGKKERLLRLLRTIEACEDLRFGGTEK